MIRSFARSLIVGGAVLSLAACDLDWITDLDTDNLNDPDLERALTEPGDVESMIASSWRPYWNYVQGATSHNIAISAMAHELTSTVGNFGVLELSDEPRTWSFNNDPAYSERWLNQSPWYALYGGLASANDGLRLIEGGMRITEGEEGAEIDVTERARAFGKFTQGIILGHFAKIFDQASVATEATDITIPEEIAFRPHMEVQAQAIVSLKEAIAIAEANSFTLPDNFIQNVTVSNDELVRIAHSYIARILAYTPRTPAERAAVDWNEVVYHLDRGIVEDHAPVAEQGVLHALYRAYHQQAWFWIDYRTIGAADVSGNYQAWVNAHPNDRERFVIETPDRRIAGENRTTDAGEYFFYSPAQGVLNPDRGLFNWSFYRISKFPNDRSLAGYQHDPIEIMSMIEMDLLRAEAYIRLGRQGDAAEIINRTRTANGQLPPVTAAGVPEDADCVPRTRAGACGDLFDALMHEKHLETMGNTAQLAWWDRRGWGTLAPGTMTQLPVPGRELETLVLPLYTFGGSPGTPGNAD